MNERGGSIHCFGEDCLPKILSLTALNLTLLSAALASAPPLETSSRETVSNEILGTTQQSPEEQPPRKSPENPQHNDQGPQAGTIYGDDDRVDLYQVKDKRVLRFADSTVALFHDSDVSAGTTGRSNLSTRQFGQYYGLCKDEPFYAEPVGAFCTGFLVGPDLLLTAGHCVSSAESCAATKFVFGFNIKEEGKYPSNVETGQVYSCKTLIGREQEDRGRDWALVQMDRPVAAHTPLALNGAGIIEKGTPLFVIGHPSGLPTKVAGGAKVRDGSPEGYFLANLDTYGGNSGSAVFNASTGLVEGILVRGERDFEPRGSCMVSKRCPEDGCRGEDVTKIKWILGKIPPKSLALFPNLASRFDSSVAETVLKTARKRADSLISQ